MKRNGTTPSTLPPAKARRLDSQNSENDLPPSNLNMLFTETNNISTTDVSSSSNIVARCGTKYKLVHSDVKKNMGMSILHSRVEIFWDGKWYMGTVVDFQRPNQIIEYDNNAGFEKLILCQDQGNGIKWREVENITCTDINTLLEQYEQIIGRPCAKLFASKPYYLQHCIEEVLDARNKSTSSSSATSSSSHVVFKTWLPNVTPRQLLVSHYSSWFCRIFRARIQGLHNDSWFLADQAYLGCNNYNHEMVTWCEILACKGVVPSVCGASLNQKQRLLFLMANVVVRSLSNQKVMAKISELRKQNGGKVL